MATISFGNLYEYNVEGGAVLPQTSDVKSSVETALKSIFGADFSVEESTINGRLIEAITMFFKDVLGVNAQNVNAMNVERAVGIYLDNLGVAYGIPRNGMTDNEYRKAIVQSWSRGSGFASSISNAILASGAEKCVVLDNGNEDPAVLPVDAAGKPYAHSITVAPHSVFISVLGGELDLVAKAIRATKAAGCGFTKYSDYGNPVTRTIAEGGNSFLATFYIPLLRRVSVSVRISTMSYLGLDAVADAKAALKTLFDDNSINSTVTKQMISAALASNGLNLICLESSISINDAAEGGTFQDVESLIVEPFRYTNVSLSDIEVIVQ